jgi:RND family efflux transporter MFP subunit
MLCSYLGWTALALLPASAFSARLLRRWTVASPNSASGRVPLRRPNLNIHLVLGLTATLVALGHGGVILASGYLRRSNMYGDILAFAAIAGLLNLIVGGLRLRTAQLAERLTLRKRHFRTWIVTLAVAVMHVGVNSPTLSLLVSARADPSGPQTFAQNLAPQVKTVGVSATGSIRLRVGADVRVGAQISGIVKKLNVTVGARVRRGDVIAVIEARGLGERIASARAGVEVEKAALEKLEHEFARKQKLRDQGLVTDEDYDNLEIDTRMAEASLSKARSDLAIQEADEDYLEIRAPIDGVVASVSTQEGETVVASFATPTFVNIIKPDALELVALVDETDIAAVETGRPATFTVESYPGRKFTGIVARIAPTATIVSGVVNYEVTISLTGSETVFLKPDMTANLVIEARVQSSAGTDS